MPKVAETSLKEKYINISNNVYLLLPKLFGHCCQYVNKVNWIVIESGVSLDSFQIQV